MLVGISNKQGWEFCRGGSGSPSAQELSPPKPLSADVTGEFSKSRIWSSCFIFKVLKRRNDNLLYICLLLCGSCWENRKPSGWLMVPWTHRSHSPHPHLCFCWTLLEACSPSPHCSRGMGLRPSPSRLSLLPGPRQVPTPSRAAWTPYHLPNTYNLAFPVCSG